MPKQLNKNVYKFKTQKVYELLKDVPFGVLLDDQQVEQLDPRELEDYVDYKIQVSRGLHN